MIWILIGFCLACFILFVFSAFKVASEWDKDIGDDFQN